MVSQVVRLLKLVFRFVFNPNTYSTDTLASSGDAPSKIGQSLSEAISYQVHQPSLLSRARVGQRWGCEALAHTATSNHRLPLKS
jgi:hypothetical protein